MIVTFAHHKGGTGKTTTCVNVAGFALARELRVLVIDMDPQANATAGLGVDVRTVKASMFDVLAGGVPLQDVILETEGGVHLAPSTIDLVNAEPLLYQMPEGRMTRLVDAIAPLRGAYDVICVDAPPGAGVLMLNALVAADRIVTTLDPGVFALEDLQALDRIFRDLAEHLNIHRRVDIAVVTRALKPPFLDALLKRQDHVAAITQRLHRDFGTVHVIPFDRAVFESQRQGLPLSKVAPTSPAARAYEALAMDVIGHG